MTTNISKENFTKYINKIQKLQEIEDNLNSIGSKLVEFHISFAEYEQLIVDVLTDVFNDQRFGWTSYFIYELNFGADWHEGCVREKDGTDIPLRDAGELYDLLVSELY